MNLRQFKDEILTELVSMKYQLVLIACIFFYLGKLTESGWITFVLSITGIRVANEIAGMAKEAVIAKNTLKDAAHGLISKE